MGFETDRPVERKAPDLELVKSEQCKHKAECKLYKEFP